MIYMMSYLMISKQIFGIVFDVVPFEELFKFIYETDFTMVLFLSGNVFADGIDMGGAYGECGIPVLPAKLRVVFFDGPICGGFF